MITDRDGNRFFAWELDAKEVARRYSEHTDPEGYDWAMARMRWLKANVSL